MPKNGASAGKPPGRAGKNSRKPGSQTGSDNQTGGQAPGGTLDQTSSTDGGSIMLTEGQIAQEPGGTLAQTNSTDGDAAQHGLKESALGAGAAPKSTPGLAVTSSQDGFWRAGRRWATTETVVPLVDLDDVQIARLRAEPTLSVKDVEIPLEATE